ncbi:hypothetical protein Clacol_001321 [Clathrus columnatus]|uniref:Uncharacterized protein n=1 Tax=Clathrus columnatus TaxID=1419009 RepID=A0AAV5A280_9AGAM|nr:hypothetical protein Clacol_001321 [Clathrus columnatus]
MSSTHPQGTFFIENVATKRRLTSYISADLPEIPLFLWPLLAFNPTYPHGQFNVEWTGSNDYYYIRNNLPFQSVRYIAHNSPSTPMLSAEQQQCRLIPTKLTNTYLFVAIQFYIVDPNEANGKPNVITDYHAPEDPTEDLQPNVERLDERDQSQMWILKQV